MTEISAKVARSYAFAHSYRKLHDRAPLVEPRLPVRYKRLIAPSHLALPPADQTLLAGKSLAQVFSAAATGEPCQQTSSPLLEKLSTLLYYNLGVLHLDLSHGVQPFLLHRAIPSPGSLYPSELIIALPENSELPAGLYHYHSFHHDLTQLHQGDTQEMLEQALGKEVGTPELTLLVSSNLWRVVRKYADFGYRLATLEAGHLIGNILLVAAALGLQGIVHYQFDDTLLERWLGNSPLDDAVMAVVTLYRPEALPTYACLPPAQAAKDAFQEPLQGNWLSSSGMNTAQAARVKEVESAIRASNSSELPVILPAQPSWSSRYTRPLTLDELTEPTCDLLSAYQGRNSGLYGFSGIAISPAPVPQGTLAFLLQHMTQPYRSDLSRFEASPPALVHVVAMLNRVRGISPGGYGFDPGSHTLYQLAETAFPSLAFNYREILNSSALGLAWGLFADYNTAFSQLGDRAYRMVNMEAGIIAQRICLLSAATQLFARPFCAYEEDQLDAWLGLEAAPEQAIYTLLSGYNRVAPFRFPVRI